jgi:hypothetical protein
MGALPWGTAEEAAEPAAEVAELAAEPALEVSEAKAPLAEEAAELRAPLAEERADPAADEAEAAAPEAAELAEAMAPEAWLAALPAALPKTVLRPVVVVMTEPAESVTVASRGTVVTALMAAEAPDWMAEPITPEALARAPVRMGTAAGMLEPEAEAAAPRHWLAA